MYIKRDRKCILEFLVTGPELRSILQEKMARELGRKQIDPKVAAEAERIRYLKVSPETCDSLPVFKDFFWVHVTFSVSYFLLPRYVVHIL